MSTDAVRIVTRGSELALWQARHVEAALRSADPTASVEIVVVKTTGDRIQDVPLAKIGDKGLFTKELDHALLNGEADLAVHSLKDVPTRLPDGLALAAVTAREDPRDVVLMRPGLSGGLDGLPAGARVGTSSLRRRAQLRALHPDLEVRDLRGNLNTRLAKLDRGEYDAILLAAAGVLRLGWEDRIAERLEPDQWLPAVGQGALAIVCRADDALTAERVRTLRDDDSTAACLAERAFLRSLEGGCQVPIAALARVRDDGELELDGLVADLDGEVILRHQAFASPIDAEALGEAVAAVLLSRGAAGVLDRARAAGVPQSVES